MDFLFGDNVREVFENQSKIIIGEIKLNQSISLSDIQVKIKDSFEEVIDKIIVEVENFKDIVNDNIKNIQTDKVLFIYDNKAYVFDLSNLEDDKMKVVAYLSAFGETIEIKGYSLSEFNREPFLYAKGVDKSWLTIEEKICLIEKRIEGFNFKENPKLIMKDWNNSFFEVDLTKFNLDGILTDILHILESNKGYNRYLKFYSIGKNKKILKKAKESFFIK